jgi:hypothetical protein
VTLDEAYQRLGLSQLDRYIKVAMGQNRANWFGSILPTDRAKQPPDMYRQLGATTWMLVRAALALGETHVMLLGRTPQHVTRLRALLLSYVERLEIAEPAQEYPNSHRIELSNAAEIWWNACRQDEVITGARGFRGTVFNDWQWAERMVRRAKGPYHMIREIRLEHDGLGFPLLSAYAEENEHIMELTFDGACALHFENPTIRCIGFTPDPSMREVWDL